MAVLPLSKVPSGSFLFIDANIFIYGLSRQSTQCHSFLDRCLREELTGITLFETVNEVTHRFMVAEALSKGLIASGGARALRRNLGLIPGLTEYWRNTERLLALNLLFLPVSEAILRGAQVERHAVGLMTNDSMIVACMREHGLTLLATSDMDFQRIPGITVFKPDDLP